MNGNSFENNAVSNSLAWINTGSQDNDKQPVSVIGNTFNRNSAYIGTIGFSILREMESSDDPIDSNQLNCGGGLLIDSNIF
jgi:hypothetical protein